MNIAILMPPDNSAAELIFSEPVVVGHKGAFLLFWRERAYRKRHHHGFVPEGMLSARLVELLPGTTFDAKVEEVVVRRGTPEFGTWHGVSGAWTEYGDGLGPCIILLLRLASNFVLELEYSLNGYDPTPWDPFSEESLLSSLEGASLVFQGGP